MTYFGCSGKIPWDSDLLQIYVKGLLICWLQKFIIWFDKLSYTNEFLELNEVIVFINSMSMVGIVNIVGKNSGKEFFKSNLSRINICIFCLRAVY